MNDKMLNSNGWLTVDNPFFIPLKCGGWPNVHGRLWGVGGGYAMDVGTQQEHMAK